MKRSTLAWLLFILGFILFAAYAQTLLPALLILGIGLLLAALIVAVNEAFPL